ncbi:putative toxin-antitoxin system toxin component, PIN family [Candidatus Woesearchaeota archaeon]|nr:putative toxin-antitoxin system toxin component, PIN family [Candidatus Woesearchaeota archaeon]|tara:strand:- start:1349 stop:1753 length:405 start_codon:yes stop_codon:yes gene_type:complete
MRITVDTNFLISATQWDYSVAHKLLKKLIENDVKIFSTKEILDEFAEVLKRDFRYHKKEVEKIIETLMQVLTIISTKIKVDIVKDDPDDNKVIECALESSSEYILTYDKHLLRLIKYEQVKIIRPEEAKDIFAK